MSTEIRTQILQAIDIVELISQTVALKRRGKDYVGLCPFHQEKTPSFHVSPSRQSFYCFGCKANGTVFDFVMKRDRIEFREALEILAKQAGIDLPRFGGSKENAGERQALIEANSAACRFFENQFWHPQLGAVARAYMAQRGFTDETLKRFQVGLAVDAWDALLTSPVGRKLGPHTLATAGLVKPRQQGGGFYDTFRNRIIFPIRSEQGQIIAFGGRILPGSQDPAKYLNSPETPLFSKSRCIFALDLARQRIVESRTVAVVEGYTDVLMAHQFKASNVVSVLGTAMTEQHVAILRRFADRIVLLFDADNAGDLAVNRVVQLFLTQPVEIAVASMPPGMDPDEYLLRHGLEAFDRLLAEATDALEYAWKQLSVRFVSGSGDLTGQQKAASEYLDLLSRAHGQGSVDQIRWGAALARVSRLLGLPMPDLHRRLSVHKRFSRKALGSHAAIAGEALQQAPAGKRLPDAQDLAEQWILGVLLLEPRHWTRVQQEVGIEEFTNPARKRLAEVFWTHQRDEGEPVFNEFVAGLDETLRSLAIELVEEVENLGDLDQRLTSALEHFTLARRKREQQQAVGAAVQLQAQAMSAEQQNELLRKLAENKARPDLRSVPYSS